MTSACDFYSIRSAGIRSAPFFLAMCGFPGVLVQSGSLQAVFHYLPNPSENRFFRIAFSKVAVRSVVERWASLPDAVRNGIMAMVKATSGCKPTSTNNP